ncbi:hypothetical protein J2Y69_001599 [Microbacterium resistens]|uniref:Uncharacterized protein n=1 Tax=Microbacterium resistens TaxID=156977 RepID=A0ABU1SBN2_9MICO|nr:hypothetical protein [Microbacterium resistens]MDR6867000.1 hypothetical protein [Microbacterium resistens]
MSLYDDDPSTVYDPPPPPPSSVPQVGTDDAPPGPSADELRTKRRSRAIVITVIAVCATLLIGAILTIVLLTSGLVSMIADRPAPAPAPVAQTAEPTSDPEPSPTPTSAPPTRASGEGCSALCTSLESEAGGSVGSWTQEIAWANAAPEVGAQDAATTVYSSAAGRVTFTVLQFPDDEAAAAAAIALRTRLGDPSFDTSLFTDGTGRRYDYDGTLVSRVLWHADAQSEAHTPGRLYLTESSAIESDDFAAQPAFLLYSALPI